MRQIICSLSKLLANGICSAPCAAVQASAPNRPPTPPRPCTTLQTAPTINSGILTSTGTFSGQQRTVHLVKIHTRPNLIAHKNERLRGKKLLLVRRLGLNDKPDGSVEMIAIDIVDAGVGDKVLVVREGSSARFVFDDPKIPVQAVIVGVIDTVNLDGS